MIGGALFSFLSAYLGTRHILNHDELLRALSAIPRMQVSTARFDFADKVPFEEQVSRMAHADVIVGLHGAGLTHALWMPPWAAVVEILNCGDDTCYRNLAALCGLAYFTGVDGGRKTVTPDAHTSPTPLHPQATSPKW